jgi:hypothetical protein
MIPIAGLFSGSTFLLEEITCPKTQALAQFSKVEVTYAEK